MKTLVLALALLLIPSVTFAHSGTVFRSVVNYAPLLVAVVPLFWESISKLITRLRNFIQGKDNE